MTNTITTMMGDVIAQDATDEFLRALVFADSLALAAGVLCLVFALLFRAAPNESGGRGAIRPLVVFWAVFWLIGNTAVISMYPISAIIKGIGYLVGIVAIAWWAGRSFERRAEGRLI